MTQVLSDGTNTYVYGLDRIAQMNGATPEYFLTDGLGSVRQLVDSTGNITLAKSYEPYGAGASFAGSGLSSYGFTGEMTDPTGLIYLRARYLAPNDGRFITRDSWMGNYNRPLSLNRWNYGYGNPVKYTDPTGHDFQFEEVNPPDKRDLTDWLPRAAVYMATDPEIQEIKRVISSGDGVQNIEALLKFKRVVQAGAQFDVKLKIRDRLGLSIQLGENWYEYSTPGNILYGFYGSAAGFKEETLHLGAGYAQLHDVFHWLVVVGFLCNKDAGPFPDFGGPAHDFDTPDDYHAVAFGVWLYQRYYVPTESFTRNNFMQGLNSYDLVHRKLSYFEFCVCRLHGDIM